MHTRDLVSKVAISGIKLKEIKDSLDQAEQFFANSRFDEAIAAASTTNKLVTSEMKDKVMFIDQEAKRSPCRNLCFSVLFAGE